MAIRRIPLEKIRAFACEESMPVVEAHWPDGVPVTVQSARKAARLGLDLDIAAAELLSEAGWAKFTAATDDAWIAGLGKDDPEFLLACAEVLPGLLRKYERGG